MIAVPSYLTTNVFGVSATKIEPVPATYSSGYTPGEEYPVENHNWFMHLLTNNVNVDITAMTSVSNEIVNYLSSQGLTPNPVDNTQLFQAITDQIGNSDGTASPYFSIGGGFQLVNNSGVVALRNSTNTAYASLQCLNINSGNISAGVIIGTTYNGAGISSSALTLSNGKALTLNNLLTVNTGALVLGNGKTFNLTGTLTVGANSLAVENSTLTLSSFNLSLTMTGHTAITLPTVGTISRENASNAIVILSGSGSWTCPAGVYKIRLIMGGGGGGGGGSYSTSSQGGGGGGGGAVIIAEFYTTPGASYSYSVGAGGTVGTSGGGLTPPTAGGNGGDSTFGTLVAGGGKGGAGGGGSGGAGGTLTGAGVTGTAGANPSGATGGNGGDGSGRMLGAGSTGGIGGTAISGANLNGTDGGYGNGGGGGHGGTALSGSANGGTGGAGGSILIEY